MQANVALKIVTDNSVPPTPLRTVSEIDAAAKLRDATDLVAASDVVIIHVRFHADSRIWEISERPDQIDREQWFKLLCAHVGDKFQTRAGGRGFFRLSRTQLELLKTLKAD